MPQIQKVNLTLVRITDSNKQGQPYVTKTGKNAGKPFKMIAIKCDAYKDQWLSDFIWDAQDTKNLWKVGDQVQIIVEKNGNYLNFHKPLEREMTTTAIEDLTKRVAALERWITSQSGKAEDEPQEPDTDPMDIDPTDVDPDSLPF